jgi:predicted transcriptional regulator
MARPASKQPTDGELEILKILWEIGPAGLGPIHLALQERKEVAITTVATMLKMMQSKGLVRREEGPRGYAYSAGISRKAAVSGLIGKLVEHIFDGSARRLVAHLIEDGQLDPREREEILNMLQNTSDDRPSRKKGGTR